MADVRALLAAEKAMRRISHPYASYTSRNVLSCTVCNLGIKSEALWEGHLKSANHRKNAARSTTDPATQPSSAVASSQQQQQQQQQSRSSSAVQLMLDSSKRKRQAEDIDSDEDELDRQYQHSRRAALSERQREYDVDGGRKKPQAADLTSSNSDESSGSNNLTSILQQPGAGSRQSTNNGVDAANGRGSKSTKHVSFAPDVVSDSDLESLRARSITGAGTVDEPANINSQARTGSDHPEVELDRTDAAADIDEGEWAAFESDIDRLESQAQSQARSQIGPASSAANTASAYTATITAAPTTSTSASQQQMENQDSDENRRRLLDTDLEDEQEDASRRLEEEFDLMQEMEERVRRLREKREALRVSHQQQQQQQPPPSTEPDGIGDDGEGEGEGEGGGGGGDDDNTKLQESSIENRQTPGDLKAEDSEDDDDEDEDEDDWYS